MNDLYTGGDNWYLAIFGSKAVMNAYCSASEVRHPSEVRHLHFMTILKRFYSPATAYMYTLLLKGATPFI